MQYLGDDSNIDINHSVYTVHVSRSARVMQYLGDDDNTLQAHICSAT